MRERFLGRLSFPKINSLAIVTLFLGTGIAKATQEAPRTVDFSRDIYPIFERSCHSCHGPALQQGKLRLDSRQAALRGGQSGKIVQAGNSAESSLYQRVAGLNDLVRMPMGGELAADEIELIRTWIEEGAEWPENVGLAEKEADEQHWAFVAPKRPSLPQVRKEAWPATAIDHFILARLEQDELSPSPEADRVALLRRLSLDLIGLPPAVEEVDTFLADQRPDAYQKQVERLLASPHYGECWGRHWLDAARYADSDGFEKDKPRRVWFYRDWVINALNRDLPYDEFIIQQLAGDLLPDAGQDQIVATGFLRNSMINAEGGIDPEQFRMEALFDRMDAIGKGILGITIQCAQCHDHKYDPLKQEEYYRLFAFLNNAHEANLAVYTPTEQMKRSEVFRRIRKLEENLKHTHPDWEQKMARRRGGNHGSWGSADAGWVRSRSSLLGQPLFSPDTPLRPQGEERYLSLHGGCSQPSGALRSQTPIGEIRRDPSARGVDQGLSGCLHQPQLQTPGPQVQVRQTRPIGSSSIRAASSPDRSGR